MEAILFDWDGTLVDSLGAFHAANSSVMAAFGLPFDVVAYRRNYVPDWQEMYRRLGVPGDRLEEANTLWETAFAGNGELVAAFPGVAAALERLRYDGAVLGIVTAGHRAIVEAQLERTGLAGLLPIRVFGDDLAVHKPDPEPLRRALRMAVAVGARAIGIESVLGDPDELRAAGAVEVAPSVAEWVDRHLAAASNGEGP